MDVRRTFWYSILSLYIFAFTVLLVKRSLIGFDIKYIAVSLVLSVSSLLIIRQYILRKTMLFAGFHLDQERVFLRAFFLAFALFMIFLVFAILLDL